MEIRITSGTGSGPTKLAAFDSALLAAGIGNYNLVPLSSVIPPGASIVRDVPVDNDIEWGHRLYVVMAAQHETDPGLEAWAGLGWAQAKMAGVFLSNITAPVGTWSNALSRAR